MAKGITKDTRSVSLKKFVPNPEINNGLVKAVLTDVTIGEAEIKQDSSWELFRGKKVPRLSFIFEEFDHDKDLEPCRHIHSYTAYPMDANIPERENWQWNQIAQTLKHLIDVFSEDDFKDEYAELLALDDTKTDFEGQLEEWTKFMNGVATVFKGDGKKLPALVGKKAWLKLLLTFKGKVVNNGDFGFPQYPGDGIVELYKEGVKPSLRVNVTKGEGIVATPYKSAKDLNENNNNAASGDVPAFMKG